MPKVIVEIDVERQEVPAEIYDRVVRLVGCTSIAIKK